MEMQTQTMNCKNCGAALAYRDGQTSVSCDYCQTVTAVQTQSAMLSRIADINTQTAAATHINIVLEKTDWNEIALDASAMTLEEVDLLIEKIKRTAGDRPETYEMCFNYLHVCSTKKYDAIIAMIPDLTKEYLTNRNYNEAANKFDALKQSSLTLKEAAPNIIEQLKEYVQMAQRQELPKPRLKALEEKMILLEALLSQINVPLSFEDVPEIKQALNNERLEQEEKYKKLGIDAASIYKQAIDLFNKDNYDAALQNFSKIVLYRDVKNYIKRINQKTVTIAKYNGTFFATAGENTLLAEGFDRTRLWTRADGLFIKDTFVTLPYAHNDTFQKYYGSKFLYQKAKSIVIVDMAVPKIKLVQQTAAFTKDYDPKKIIDFYGDIHIVVYKENLIESKIIIAVFLNSCDKIFCKARKTFFAEHAKGASPAEPLEGSLDIWEYDIAIGTLTLKLENVDEVERSSDDDLFFIKPEIDTSIKIKRGMKPACNYHFCCLTRDGKSYNNIISGRATLIEKLENGYVLFKRFQQHSSNKNNFDLVLKKGIEASAQEITIERNVFEYNGYHNGKILYSIGNAQVRGLYAYDIASGQVDEVFKYMASIAFMLENWIYVKIGRDNMFSLIRKSLSGGKWQLVVPVAQALVRIPRETVHFGQDCIKGGRVYYQNLRGELCSVNLNGQNGTNMIKGFKEIVGITKDKVYYLASDDSSSGLDAIYYMNHQGSMRHKLITDVIDATSFFGERIFYTQQASKAHKELHANVSLPKMQKAIEKARKKYDKAGFDVFYGATALNVVDCTTQNTKQLAVEHFYPTMPDIKNFQKNFKINYSQYKYSRTR